MTNRDLLNLLKERVSTARYAQYNNIRVNALMRCLKDDNYRLTSRDVEILNSCNIYVPSLLKTNIKKDSFVVLSDFHGYEYPVDKIVNYYLNEYEYIYILGDATDRGPLNDGTGSIPLLLKIKLLCDKYPNRVIYVPGNHDSFIVGHDRGDSASTIMMEKNKGSKTRVELDVLKKDYPQLYNSLISWLSKLPLQRMHKCDGKVYALAHAFFDQSLYNVCPTYNLDQYFSINDVRENYGKRVIWFRKEDMTKEESDYVARACPSGDVEVIIGHSQSKAKTRKHDLVNINGEKVKVHCVDGGISYNGGMLKYDNNNGVVVTKRGEHIDTSEGCNYTKDEVVPNAILKNYIVSLVYERGSQAFDRSVYLMPATITNEDFAKAVDFYEGFLGFSYNSIDYQDRFFMYKKIVIFNLILGNLLNKYGTIESVQKVFNGYFIGDEESSKYDSTWFTRDNDTRYLAECLGAENIVEVLSAHGCSSVSEYLRLKTYTDEKGKVKIKL